jgi:hypothetical protein
MYFQIKNTLKNKAAQHKHNLINEHS